MNNNNFIKRIFSSSKEESSSFDNATENTDVNTQEANISLKEEYKAIQNIDNNLDIFFQNKIEISQKLKDLLEKISFDSIYLANAETFNKNYNHFYGSKKRFTILFYYLIFTIFSLFSIKVFFSLSFNQLIILLIPILFTIFFVTKEYSMLKKIAASLPIPNEFIKKFIFKAFNIHIPFFNRNLSYSQIEKKENFQMLYHFFKSRPEDEIFYYFKEYVRLKNPNNLSISDIEKRHLQKFGEYISSILRYKKITPKNNKHKSFEELEQDIIIQQNLSENQNLNFFLKDKNLKNSTKK